MYMTDKNYTVTINMLLPSARAQGDLLSSEKLLVFNRFRLGISSANFEDSEYTRNRHRYNLPSYAGYMVSFLRNIGHTLNQLGNACHGSLDR